MAQTIAIIGGGISGLSLLHFFKKHHPDLGVTLYESKSSVGGNIKSLKEDGFVFECGPNGFLSNQPAVFELIEDLGIADQVIEADAKASRRYVYMNGKLNIFPMDPLNFIRTSLLTSSEKFHLIGGLFKKIDPQDLSIAAYVSRRFGVSVAQNLVDPFISGIYAGNINRLHAASAFPQKKTKAKGKAKLKSFQQGMGQLIEALHRQYNEHIKCNAPIQGMDHVQADHIFCTAPAYGAADFLQDKDPALAALLNSIYYAPVIVLGFAFPVNAFKQIPDGFGFLIPSHQKKKILGVLIESNVYQDRSPQGMVMIRVMVGGAHHPSIHQENVADLKAMALKELDHIYGLKAHPIKEWQLSYSRAIPQYEIGYAQKKADILNRLKSYPHLHLSGNYLDGISFNDCVYNAKNIALNFTKG